MHKLHIEAKKLPKSFSLDVLDRITKQSPEAFSSFAVLNLSNIFSSEKSGKICAGGKRNPLLKQISLNILS